MGRKEELRMRPGKLEYGYNSYTEEDGKNSDMLMDYGILKMKNGHVEVSDEDRERAYLLIFGEVTFQWEDNKVEAKRGSCFDEDPWCLHVPAGVEVKITGGGEAEISVQKKYNPKKFPSAFYRPEDVRVETRGIGTMNETNTRVVKTIIDKSINEDSNIVLGEIICFPGKWGGFTPHYHAQPEIYFYKFFPENGYGFLEVGDDVVKVKHNDGVKLAGGTTHPHVTAPGYAMYCIWTIPHLEDNPYIKPINIPEHEWLLDQKAKIWPEK
ncbi:MAG: 5-deoxy-glucuronate isomerase [Marinisporobacter sp.]|jgi:5-deoxy-glucuronate isomerase|nr:5-deoxy-glucuronate isomerase [Marinisporobacter sp.]